jgi:twitching motility two-component system response regulator PilH
MARILLIEDSPTDTAVLTQLLERNGHQRPQAPKTASSSASASCRTSF